MELHMILNQNYFIELLNRPINRNDIKSHKNLNNKIFITMSKLPCRKIITFPIRLMNSKINSLFLNLLLKNAEKLFANLPKSLENSQLSKQSFEHRLYTPEHRLFYLTSQPESFHNPSDGVSLTVEWGAIKTRRADDFIIAVEKIINWWCSSQSICNWTSVRSTIKRRIQTNQHSQQFSSLPINLPAIRSSEGAFS